MKAERVVVNASPLILLFKSGLVDLLPQLFTDIVITDAVWKEVVDGGSQDLAATTLPAVSWVRRVSISTLAPDVVIWNLGDGESEVLSFALRQTEYRAMIDDRAARNCARTLGIQTLGTGGALVLAKRRGLISSVSEELQKLIESGLWLSDEIINF